MGIKKTIPMMLDRISAALGVPIDKLYQKDGIFGACKTPSGLCVPRANFMPFI